MAKFHINPEKGPLLCKAKRGNCPYGVNAPHYSSKEEALSAYEDILKNESPLFVTNKKDLDINILSEKLELISYSELEEIVDSNPSIYQAFEKVLDERMKYSSKRALQLENCDPKNIDATNKVDSKTFRAITKDFDLYRNKTAELVEALGNSKFYNDTLIELDENEHIGNLVPVTGFESNSKEWLEARFNSIGGSDVGAIAVMDFKSEESLSWFDKKNFYNVEKSKISMPTPEDVARRQNLFGVLKTGAAYRGTVWERRIASEYAKAHPGYKVFTSKRQYAHPDRPWQTLNMDGFISDRKDGQINGILEIKTSGNPGDWKDGVPIGYRAQTLYYLNSTGLDFADVRVLINDHEYRDFRINKNDEVSPGSGVTMNEYIKTRVQPWFDGLKESRVAA